MGFIRKVVTAVDQILVWGLTAVTAVLLCSIVILVVYQVVSRYILRWGTPWGEELPLFLNVWFTTCALPLVFRFRGHVAIEFFVQLLPKQLKVMIIKLTDITVTGFGVFLAVEGWRISAQFMNARMATIPWPLGTLYVGISLGGASLAIFGLLMVLESVKEQKLPE